ncbi:hypothetical protein CUMW_168240 [Citrus unshiu]|uniref:Heparanase-like protein 1 n=1 Tax=Citrus unshiu TaxID=55188 RepID=A0A2H5PUE1_CITUN|nr:hypothetical protein CUMW_168240 [Citrus unshiu]
MGTFTLDRIDTSSNPHFRKNVKASLESHQKQKHQRTCSKIILARDVTRVTIFVDATKTVATNDEHFICATVDWWPHDKCNYNHCPWGNSSVINLLHAIWYFQDLSHPLLANAIQAFQSLRIRIGGSLQDQVLYDVGDLKAPCHPFRKMKDGLFGCLAHATRWDAVNTNCIYHQKVSFGLNALHGRHNIRHNAWGGAWDSNNARDFLKYTISMGYQIDSWEYGNELSGRTSIGASIDAELYGKDLINLKNIINELYKNSSSKPTILAPGGFFDQEWYAKFLQVSGSNVVNGVTHHIYNLGPGVDPNLVSKILNPQRLSRVSETFGNLKQTIEKHGPWASAWVGESGGAYNSGGRHVSNTFVNSFWYLDQLGMSSNALLWHRLMGKGVLSVATDGSSSLRSYAHCSKEREGITLLLINLSNQTDYVISVHNSMNMKLTVKGKDINGESSLSRDIKRAVSWVGSTASDGHLTREEYHLTPKDGYLQSQTMVLNGIPLQLAEDEGIPKLDPVRVDVNSPIYITHLSIAFIVFPNFSARACVV